MNATTDSSEDLILQKMITAIEQRIPCIIFIGCLSVIGILGNIHVLILFTRADRRTSTYTVFVKALSIVDLITCIVHMPIEIVDLMKPYTFYSEVGCKLFRLNNAFLLMSSVSILVLIALERYRRVCNPMKRQMTVTVSRLLCILVIFISLLITVPMYFVNGHHFVKISENGVNATGYMCFISDEFHGSMFLYSYIGFMSFVFLISSSTLLIAYFSISRVVFCRDVSIRRSQASVNNLRKDIYTIPVLDNASNDSHASQKPIKNSEADIYTNISIGNRTRLKSSTLRTTRPLILITAIFIIVFAPYIILNFVNSFDKEFKDRLTNFELSLYQIGVRLLLINNVSNPFVYGFTDERFKNGIRSLYCRKK